MARSLDSQADRTGLVGFASGDYFHNREPAHLLTGAVQAAGELSFFGKREKFEGKLNESFRIAVGLVHDENSKAGTAGQTDAAAVTDVKIYAGRLIDIGFYTDGFLRACHHAGIAGNLLKAFSDGYRAFGETLL